MISDYQVYLSRKGSREVVTSFGVCDEQPIAEKLILDLLADPFLSDLSVVEIVRDGKPISVSLLSRSG